MIGRARAAISSLAAGNHISRRDDSSTVPPTIAPDDSSSMSPARPSGDSSTVSATTAPDRPLHAAVAFLRRHRTVVGAAAVGAVLVVGAAACGDDGGGDAATLSEAGRRGRQISNQNGCASCHGSDGQGGVGPTWEGLAGSEVELDDGRVVVADDEYLRRAIVDPSAERTAGYTLQMPQNQLSDSEVDDVIAYIRDLSPDADSGGGDGTAVTGATGDAAAPTGAGVGGTAGVAGIVRTPAPSVDDTTLPSLTTAGEDVEFDADDGKVKAVYFGYTSCPDVCPTTMADLAVALRKLPDGMSDRVETVFVTVDPERDLDVAAGYVRSFVPGAEAAGTLDAERLAAAAEPFGVVYDVTTDDDGEVVVEHSPFLYLVNDDGELLVSWQFGETSDNMAADIETFLDRDGEPV